MTMTPTRTYTGPTIDENAHAASPINIDKWTNLSTAGKESVRDTTSTSDPPRNGDQPTPQTLTEAKQLFKEAIEDAEEEGYDAPKDETLVNGLRAVQLIEDHCPQGLSSVAVLHNGTTCSTARGSNVNYISVECRENGEVVVLFRLMSHAKYDNMDQAEQNGFLKSLLETLRY